jgi:SAM-dependent methyltransferase
LIHGKNYNTLQEAKTAIFDYSEIDMEPILNKLNLGCGQYPKEGFLNIDVDPNSKADKIVDFNRLSQDLPNNHFELVEADHFLEHLDDPMKIMKEIHRILKPGGILHMRVPHFSRGFTHWEHKRGFDVSYPLYFQKDFAGGYVGIDFKLKKMRLCWFAQPTLKKNVLSSFQFLIGSILGKLIDFFCNLSPYACSRIWCFWVGGIEEIEFVFMKPKN